MTQYIELNSELAHYQPLTISELNYENIKENYDIEYLSTPQEIDDFVLNELDKLLNELKESGFDLNYLEPLFIKQKMFKEHEVITKDTDLEIVSMYNQDFGSEAANQYAVMSIDFYYIERYLRTRRHVRFQFIVQFQKNSLKDIILLMP